MAEKPEKTIIFAPVSGIIVPITEVPDPTFAEKMVGDGIAIDPTEETLFSPCDGKVAQLHPSCHALTITSPGGAEILMHIGLETVSLKGNGFKSLIAEGDIVRRGDPLIEFDADYIAKHASSLLTMIVITNGERGNVKQLAAIGVAKAGETPLLDVSLTDDPIESQSAGGVVKSMPIVILNPNGLHARPASVLVNSAKRFSCSIRISGGNRDTNAKSVVGILGLAIKQHDSIIITAEGDDAANAISYLVPLIQAGLGENLHAAPGGSRGSESACPAPQNQAADDPDLITGTPASPGLAAGSVFQLRDSTIRVKREGLGAENEKKSLRDAISASIKELDEIEKSMRLRADTGKAAIFAAHKELLEDPELIELTMEGIERGESAAFAWRGAFTAQAEALGKLSNELLAARAGDIRDIGARVLSFLTGSERRGLNTPENSILVARDLTPSDTASLNTSGAIGFCITGGSATSHASILARAAGIPAVVAIKESVLDLPDGTPVILDGERGVLKLNPSLAEVAEVRAKQREAELVRREELAAAAAPAVTMDGVRIKVVGNISGVSEAAEIPSLGGDGVGLLRSEFLFLQRADAPSENEQSEVYAAISNALGAERDLIVRTLDVGGDKPLAYMPLPKEENPFLGLRGIRLNMLGTDIFTSQVRAILRAAPSTKLGIMFPMVATAEEFRVARDITLREREALGVKSEVRIGIMVEVPSAALMADLLAPEVDFFSIGTNDLTQYTLAMDRGHPKLAKMADALHPAVLRLISFTVKSAHKAGKWVGVCGGIASDVKAVPILLGLGVDELSVSIKSIPSIKAAVRRLNMDRCASMAHDALEMRSAGEVRSFLAKNAAYENHTTETEGASA
jgi:phosphocarrier protein FPr